jgi:hypothetical protein
MWRLLAMNPLNGVTITRLQPGTTLDPYSLREVADWGQTTRTTIEGCIIAPFGQGTGETQTLDRERTTQTLNVLLPPGTEINRQDRVEIGGDQFTIVGIPYRIIHPFTGWEPGIQLRIEREYG